MPEQKANNTDSDQDLSRSLPKNLHAEQMLLGSIIINSDLIDRVSEFLRPEHFYEKLHQKIYDAVQILREKGISASTVTLKSMLDKEPLYKEANGHEYLIKLTTIAMVVINPYDYGKVIYDLAIKRNLITIGEDIVNNAYDSTLEQSATEHLEIAEHKLYELASEGLYEKGFTSIQEAIKTSMLNIDRAMKNKGEVVGISTGFIDLDKILSGFHNSDLIIVAGRPGMGKTAFALNFAFNACKDLAKKTKEGETQPSVGFFSLEMPADQLTSRLLSMSSEINSTKLKTGSLNEEEEYNKVKKASIEIGSMKFFIDDTPALSISAIRTRARRLKRNNNLAILFIDYLQLLRGTGRPENRVLEISEITQGLKAIAKELNIPVIALSQLSRAVEQRHDKRPMLSDLRESGSIEQDADLVMFLYRKEYYLKNEEPSNGTGEDHVKWVEEFQKSKHKTEIIIAKHRNGSLDNVHLKYITEYSRIENLAKESQIDTIELNQH